MSKPVEKMAVDGNYRKQVLIAQELFLKYDPERMAEKFGLKKDEQYLYVTMLRRLYRIRLSTGEIEMYCEDECKEHSAGENVETMSTGETRTEDSSMKNGWIPCMEYTSVMTICDILCCSVEHPVLSGEWCPTASLQKARVPSTGSMFRSYALRFLERSEELNEVCRKLGGTHLSVPASADACYQIDLFPFFPIIFQFWDGDDEFEPKIMILWDRKALDFMHFETLYYAMGVILERMQELMEEILYGR